MIDVGTGVSGRGLLSADAVVAHIQGGLGNQLFQIAAAQQLAGDRPLWVDLRYYGHDGSRRYVLPRLGLDLPRVPARMEVLLPRIGDSTLKRLWPSPFRSVREGSRVLSTAGGSPVLPSRAWLLGYWQEPVYALARRGEFSDIVGSLLPELGDRGQLILRQLQSGATAAVHVRRGDYVTNPGASSTFAVQGADYYRRGMAWLRERGFRRFLVFTDDPSWAAQSLASDDCSVVPSATDDGLEDFVLMAQARALIISNSSYSWWAAVLSPADVHVVAPNIWFKSPHDDRGGRLLAAWTTM